MEREKRMEITEAKKLVIKAGLELVESGLIARTWGNVSCRVDEESFVITPSGREYQTLTPDDIVQVTISDLSYAGSVKPSSEKGIHAAAYRLRPEIKFAIHTHQENASALSANDFSAIQLAKTYPGLGDRIICAKYALPGSKALRKNVTEALRKSKGDALILRHHGTLCLGKDYDKAFETAHQLEIACRDYVNSKGGQMDEADSNTFMQIPPHLLSYLEDYEQSGKKGCLIWSSDPDVVHFSRLGKELKPLLDDFAQIVGLKVQIAPFHRDLISKALKSSSAVLIQDMGALCWGKNKRDAEAVRMITRKNCKAYFAAVLFENPKPIKWFECLLMRQNFLKNYSRIAEKKL